MQDAVSDALSTIERQITKILGSSTNTTSAEDVTLANAGMTIFAFILGRLDTIASSLEVIARRSERNHTVYQQGFAAGVEKASEIA